MFFHHRCVMFVIPLERVIPLNLTVYVFFFNVISSPLSVILIIIGMNKKNICARSIMFTGYSCLFFLIFFYLMFLSLFLSIFLFFFSLCVREKTDVSCFILFFLLFIFSLLLLLPFIIFFLFLTGV